MAATIRNRYRRIRSQGFKGLEWPANSHRGERRMRLICLYHDLHKFAGLKVERNLVR